MDDWHQETAQVERRLQQLASQKLIERCINFITVGSLTDNKNQMVILQAMIKLKSLNIKFILWVAGDGENKDKYQNFVDQNELRENVFFLGHIEQRQLRAYYRRADIAVQAPLHEGFGKVPIEGFFHGVVPVISDVNLSRSIVGGNDRGRVFSNQNELVEHIYSLSRDSASMAEAIKNGREYAKENTLECWGQKIIEQIESR
jgi:glycosyltransferase involved in cell wall biosynthesis